MSAQSGVGEEIRTYRSYVDGKDLEGSGWVYVLSTRALLDDAFASMTLKRNLEQGKLGPSAATPGVIVGRVAIADQQSIDGSLSAAAAAAPVWGAQPVSVRVEKLFAGVHRNLVEHADTIVEMLTAEGHPLALAKWEVSGMLEAYGPEARAFYASQIHLEFDGEDGRKLIVRRQPDGVVCVNPPANAPLASAMLGAMALAAGNAVVIRAPRSAPLGVMYALRELVAPVLDELGAPAGTLGVLCGHAGPMIDSWISSPYVNDIMYFGGSPNGLAFERKCVAAGKKPILELAGNDALVVWKDADLEYAAEALTESFYGSGQLCMIPNQAIVHPDVADELIERLVEKVSDLKPGYPEDEGVLLTPVLRNEKFYSFLDDAVKKGATLVTGGGGRQLDGTRDDNGMFLDPTIVRIDGLDKARELDAVREETFFPLLPVVVASTTDDAQLLEELVEYVNSNAYGLRNSVWAEDPKVIDTFVTRITNGGLLKINDSHIGFVARLPTHGGTGLTGGASGEANYPMLRASHLQGVSISARGLRPRDAVFGGWNRAFGGGR